MTTADEYAYGLPPSYEHIYSGKVRDLYATPGGNLLMVASDRVSAFDWVLDTTIPNKGAILTQLSLWWFEQIADLVPNHLAAEAVPEAVAGRAVVVKKLQMYPVECVVRGYLTGSGLIDYRASGEVCGVPLPAGLVDGSRLPHNIFTPATKAALGDHDENVNFDYVEQLIGAQSAADLRDLSMAVYARAQSLAVDRGILLADTKFEFGSAPGQDYVIADEVCTPDSSRFWPKELWEPGQTQPSFDKQIIRNWLLSPESQWDRHGGLAPPALPTEVVELTRRRYAEAFEKLTGAPWASA